MPVEVIEPEIRLSCNESGSCWLKVYKQRGGHDVAIVYRRPVMPAEKASGDDRETLGGTLIVSARDLREFARACHYLADQLGA